MVRNRLPRGVVGEARSVAPEAASARLASAFIPAGAAELLGLQRQAGNQATLAHVGLQAKLLVGSAYDPAERQADEIAHHVMRQLRGGDGGSHADEVAEGDASLRRVVEAAGPIGLAGGEVSSEVASSIQSERGRGHALPATVLQPFERAFGTDLTSVRVHHDDRSSELNRAVSARAFTVGSDIFLGASQYSPSTQAGQELLAHEVTHTIQQRGGG